MWYDYDKLLIIFDNSKNVDCLSSHFMAPKPMGYLAIFSSS